MATHSSTLAWKIPWTEERGRLYSPLGHKESDTTERLHVHFSLLLSGYMPRSRIAGSYDFPGGSDNKESACDVGDLGLIPELGRSPGERNSKPLQYSCLENPIDKGAWWATVPGVAKSQT